MSLPHQLVASGAVRWGVAGWLVVAAHTAGAQAPAPRSSPGEVMLERTVAIVGGAVVTESEVKTAVSLALVEPGGQGSPADAIGIWRVYSCAS